MERKIKVLVVDDAAFMRKAVTRILETDTGIEVVGAARNGLEALEEIRRMDPDVVTLDIDMPIMDGLTAMRHIMVESPRPVVALSSLFSDGAVTFDALRLGIVDFVPKPSGAVSTDIDTSGQQLIDRIKIACSMNLTNVRRVRLRKNWAQALRVDRLYAFQPLEYMIVIGTTLTGPNTIIRLLSKLSPFLPAAIIVHQEISPKIIDAFVAEFNRHVPWRVEAARDGMIIQQGACCIGSTEHALGLELSETGEVRLHSDMSVAAPLDALFSSASEIFGRNTIGLLLTGIGSDGARGFARIKAHNGTTIVQDRQCCVFPNLTDNAIQKGVVDLIIDERQMPHTLESLMAT
ncbi:chemotaxis protein CheB [Desulfococcus sp.]|uniref:chemotaxis protein CheB n=1 Tax=Desulfococcus sp. TaxID=2025834 RepID=UPI003593DAD5